jgi:hypothetical protein
MKISFIKKKKIHKKTIIITINRGNSYQFPTKFDIKIIQLAKFKSLFLNTILNISYPRSLHTSHPFYINGFYIHILLYLENFIYKIQN